MYGWINADRFQRVQEKGPGQIFEVGYLKTGIGTPPQIELTVEDVEGTASMYANTSIICHAVSISIQTLICRKGGWT